MREGRGEGEGGGIGREGKETAAAGCSLRTNVVV